MKNLWVLGCKKKEGFQRRWALGNHGNHFQSKRWIRIIIRFINNEHTEVESERTVPLLVVFFLFDPIFILKLWRMKEWYITELLNGSKSYGFWFNLEVNQTQECNIFILRPQLIENCQWEPELDWNQRLFDSSQVENEIMLRTWVMKEAACPCPRWDFPPPPPTPPPHQKEAVKPPATDIKYDWPLQLAQS